MIIESVDKVLNSDCGHLGPRSDVRWSKVGCDKTVAERVKLVVKRERLRCGDIETRCQELATFQSVVQSVLVNDDSSRDVDEDGVAPHFGERVLVEQFL